jgi:hypothetical protein
MNKVGWGFLSNHGRVFCYLAKYPKNTIEEIARDTCLSIAGANRIINDLEEGGYITRQKVGRRNEYKIHPGLPMRHHLEWDRNVADILPSFGDIKAPKSRASSERYIPTTDWCYHQANEIIFQEEATERGTR